jgi:hypothetical protein
MFPSPDRHDSQGLFSSQAYCLNSVTSLRRRAFAVARRGRYVGLGQSQRPQKRFQGIKDYVATDDLTMAVNAAVVLEPPLHSIHHGFLLNRVASLLFARSV